MKENIESLYLENFGPIKEANITFGDLTVIIGPQATGKSILMQTLKLILDNKHIHNVFRDNNIDFKNDANAFFDAYYGTGMSSILKAGESSLWVNDEEVNLLDYAKRSRKRYEDHESLFFIPAQRVVSLPNGLSQPFNTYRFGDPYSLRNFSDVVHRLLQTEFGNEKQLFPKANRLRSALKDSISDNIYGGADLIIDDKEFTKKLALNVADGPTGLPYLAWSAGQREFTPLLLGMYWLCPPGKTSRRENIEWVVVEEPEMGLHPQAISTTLLLIIELLGRGYKVVLATHSVQVLDMVWTLNFCKQHAGTEKDVRKLFTLNAANGGKALAEIALKKNYKVYFFQRGKAAQDISELDPGSDDLAVAHWGGLTDFAGKAGDVVSDVANRAGL